MKKKVLSKKMVLGKQTVANLSLNGIRGGRPENPTFQAVSGTPCVLQSGCGCTQTDCVSLCSNAGGNCCAE